MTLPPSESCAQVRICHVYQGKCAVESTCGASSAEMSQGGDCSSRKLLEVKGLS